MYCKLSYIPLLCTLTMQSTKKISDLHLPFKQAVTVWFKCTSPKVILTRISWWLPLWVWLKSAHLFVLFPHFWTSIIEIVVSNKEDCSFQVCCALVCPHFPITLSHARNVLLFYSFNDVIDQLILFSTIPPLWQQKRLILWTLNIHRKRKWLQQYYHSNDHKKKGIYMSKIIGVFVAFQKQSFLFYGKLHVQSSAVIGDHM